MKKYTQLIIWGIVVVLVIVLAMLASNKEDETLEIAETQNETEVEVMEEEIEVEVMETQEEEVSGEEDEVMEEEEEEEIEETEEVEEEKLSRKELRQLKKEQEAMEEEEAEEASQIQVEVVPVAEEVEQVAVSTTSVIEPVVEGEFVYSFEGVKWEYTDLGESTKVGMRLENFRRREGGAPANFARPYSVGTYAGTCTQATMVPDAMTSDALISAAACGEVTLVVFQNAADKKMIEVKAYQDGSWSDVRTLDITTLIK